MKLLSLRGLFISCSILLSQGTQLKANADQALQVTIYWEGRSLENPNMEALEKLRAAQPGLLITHLINPSYFLDQDSAEENRRQLLRIIMPEDQVGLYLSSIESLVRASGLMVRYEPTFWGENDSSDFCQSDCGLDVPLSGRSREELLKIMATADRLLKEEGFQGATAFAVRGWIDSELMRGLARSFAYQHDLSLIDHQLFPAKLMSFPLFAWNEAAWRDRLQSLSPEAKPPVLNGGAIDFTEASLIVSRFGQHFASLDTPHKEAFRLVFSQESAYYSAPRLREVLKGIGEKASQKGFKIVFQTPSDVKNGRPSSENRHISEL